MAAALFGGMGGSSQSGASRRASSSRDLQSRRGSGPAPASVPAQVLHSQSADVLDLQGTAHSSPATAAATPSPVASSVFDLLDMGQTLPSPASAPPIQPTNLPSAHPAQAAPVNLMGHGTAPSSGAGLFDDLITVTASSSSPQQPHSPATSVPPSLFPLFASSSPFLSSFHLRL
jgi:hypothetical protein